LSFYGGQAVAALIGTASAGLVIENLVLEGLQIIVEEGDAVHVRQGTAGGIACRQADTGDFL
jgi:uridine phosphorylase